MKKETKKETLYCYIRVSTDEQKSKDLSPAQQKNLGRKKADELGMSVVIMEEEGASASQENFDNRPVFFSLLNLVKAGKAKHIFVFDQSRLSRNDLTKAVIINSFRKAGVQLHTFSKRYDMDKAEDVLTFNILQAIEGYESALRKARFQLGYVSGNKLGRFLKGIPPFGYKKDLKGYLVVDQEEKEVFLKIVDMYLNKNFGTNQIANWLNENNIPTKTSKIFKNGYKLAAGIHNRKQEKVVLQNKWNPGTINIMLKHELYIGHRRFKTGNDSYEFVDVEPLIDKVTFERIQSKREHNLITKHKTDKYFYLLKGLLQCGKCGQPLHGRIKPNRGETSYVCNSKRDPKHSCKSRGVNIEKLNDIVWNSFRTSIAYQIAINQNIRQQMEKPTEVKKVIEKLNAELLKLNAEKRKIESHIKNTLTNVKAKKSIMEEVLKELDSKIKMIDDNILSTEFNLKSYTEREKTQTSGDSVLKQGYNYFKLAEQRITKLLSIKTKDSLIEAQQLFRQFIENVVITWSEKLREHIIEVKFYKSIGNPKTEYLTISDKTKFKRLELLPVEYKLLDDDNGFKREYGLKIDQGFRKAMEIENFQKMGITPLKKSPPPYETARSRLSYDAANEMA